LSENATPTFVYRSPVKHSVTIAGHETAITLEPIFWAALREAAQAQSLPLNALIARIDVERIATADAPNLANRRKVRSRDGWQARETLLEPRL
jgi:predicted DNA-binding ribbon-helix-helix protein